MRKSVPSALAILLVSVSVPVSARGRFIAYEGDSARHTGTGGASIVRDGVEFWTSGTPARRFEILGTLSDTRSSGVTSTGSVGSASLARQARSLGGDGLILAGQRERRDGSVGGWTGGDTIGLRGFHMTYTTTNFVVVRYLD
jgi:hypothetical protein